VQTHLDKREATRDRIALLKRRRDALLNTAGTRQERRERFEAVQAINREIRVLQAQRSEP
jgi:hypothetical protein